MKGVSFQKPLELRLEIDGENWQQGDPVAGRLTVKNHGPEPLALAEMGVHLGYGKLKKVHQKGGDALEIIASKLMSANESVRAGQETTFEWSFQTDRNCPITDNLSSMFILYGRGANPEQLGALQLTVRPYSLIREFVDAVTTQFRFVAKGQKSSKGVVETKLAPPDSKGFAMLESLVLRMRFEGEKLEATYVFNVKGMEASAAAVDLKKKKKEVHQSFLPTDYLTSTGRVNHERLEAAIKTALSEVESKISF
jgi:hypothetical protein